MTVASADAEPVAWSELIAPDGSPREGCAPLVAILESLSGEELHTRSEALARSNLDKGITFDIGGVERPFPLDLVPRVITAHEWAVIEQGVKQRVSALEAFLADAYGRQEAIRDEVVPRSVILSSKHFLRPAFGVEPPNGVRIHVCGTDLIRDAAGAFRVLEDNVRVPSGVSYVLTNRRAVSQILPDAYAALRVRPVGQYAHRLLRALRAAAPVENPVVVVLSPGIYNSAYFEHSLLARVMGVELVEGRDLSCHGGRVWMRTTTGEQQVDVIYRRVDDDFLDQLHFRSDSLLGCPGLLTAARAGNVAIANAVGNGVADDKLLYTYVPDLIRYYLGEEPVIDNVPTWRLEEREHLTEVLDRLPELVVKPVDGAGGKDLFMGPAADAEEAENMRRRLLRDPRGWIAQPVVQLSTVPTVIGDSLHPRHVDLRPFAVNDGDDVWVLPGGLTRVALPEGQLVVNSSQGGGSKDTWVLDAGSRSEIQLPPPLPAQSSRVRMAAPLEKGPDGSHVEQQQQQEQMRVVGDRGDDPC